MMEFIFVSVVVESVIFFCALFSLTNERQRKPIDQLREQVTLWGYRIYESDGSGWRGKSIAGDSL